VLDLLDVDAVTRQKAAERGCRLHVLELLRCHERERAVLREQLE
jgi:hypothetical protein